ncbi:MAG: hypothetical protein ACHQT6_05705 [Candidatus Acidiferrales bacterium]
MKTRWLIATAIALICMTTGSAQVKVPPAPKNAVLLYWRAFAQMEDYPTDEATSDLMEKIVAGDAPWDENKFGHFLDDNKDAIETMQRGSRLSVCDWGLEYRAGLSNQFPIPFWRNSSRALARLNTLQGVRLLSEGRTDAAVSTWLAGIRFSQHLAAGGTLIFKLVGLTALESSMNALLKALDAGQLNAEQEGQVVATLHSLPSTGFDWSEALALEEVLLEIDAEHIRQCSDTAKCYHEIMGEPAPEHFTLPNSGDIAACRRLYGEAESALRLPPDQAEGRLRKLQVEIKQLHPFFQRATPSFLRINETRTKVQAERQKLLQSLDAR